MEVVCFKIFITIFFQNLFSHSRSRIFTRIEWWYSQAPNRSREEDTDDFRFLGLGRGLMHGGVKCGSAEITRISLADQEFSPGSNGGTPRLQIDLGKKIQTIFDSWLSGPGKLQHCPDWPRISQIFEISALVGNPSPTSTNTLFSPPNHSPPIVIDSRPDFAYDTSPIAGRSHQSFSSSGACGTCVSYDMHLRKLFTPLPHKYFVPRVFSPTLLPSQVTYW